MIERFDTKGTTGGDAVIGKPFASPFEMSLVRLSQSDPVLVALQTNNAGSCAVYLPPNKRGAPRFETRWSRIDPKGVVYSQEFVHRTENRHDRPDIVASGEDKLADPKGRIYRVDYACDGAACGWSYNPRGGYDAAVTIAPDGSKFHWQRKWDGDPALDKYIAFFEVPEMVCVSDCSPSAEVVGR